MHSGKVRIGSWQGRVSNNDFSANIKKVREVIEEASPGKLDFLCFPESYLSGYSAEAIAQSSVPVDHTELRKLVQESKLHNTVILVGFSEKCPDGIYNSVLVFHRGEILGVPRKTMLTGYDKKHFRTDYRMPLMEAGGIRFGVAVCHTTSFPEPALYLRWKSARLLFTPHFNCVAPDPKGDQWPINFWRHRTAVLNNQAALAALMRMVVVRSNVIVFGKKDLDDGLGCGDSNIWDMEGNCVARGTPFVESLVTAEFERKIFTDPHWINQEAVPLEMMENIYDAAKKYHAKGFA